MSNRDMRRKPAHGRTPARRRKLARNGGLGGLVITGAIVVASWPLGAAHALPLSPTSSRPLPAVALPTLTTSLTSLVPPLPTPLPSALPSLGASSQIVPLPLPSVSLPNGNNSVSNQARSASSAPANQVGGASGATGASQAGSGGGAVGGSAGTGRSGGGSSGTAGSAGSIAGAGQNGAGGTASGAVRHVGAQPAAAAQATTPVGAGASSASPARHTKAGLIDHLIPGDVSAPVKSIVLILVSIALLGALLTLVALRTGRRTPIAVMSRRHTGRGRGRGRGRGPTVDEIRTRLEGMENIEGIA